MKNIILLCAGGMSSSMLEKRIKEACNSYKIEASVSAHGISYSKRISSNTDLILIAPQVRYALETIKKDHPDKVVQLIDMIDYGKMDGNSIVKKVLEILI